MKQNISFLGFVTKILILASADLRAGGSDGKKSACNAGDLGSIPGLGRRKWQPTLVFLPRKSHGQRSLVGYI